MDDATREKFDQLLSQREERRLANEREAEEERAVSVANLERAQAAYEAIVRPAIERVMEYLHTKEIDASLVESTESRAREAVNFRVESSVLSIYCRSSGALDLQPTIDGSTLRQGSSDRRCIRRHRRVDQRTA